MQTRKAYLLDADYIIRNNKTYVRLLLKGKKTVRLYFEYEPYFYADCDESRKKDIEKIRARHKDGGIARVSRTEPCEKLVSGRKKMLLKVFCHTPADVPVIKEAMPFPCHEYNIPFAKRFIMDFQLTPFGLLRYVREGRIIKNIVSCELQNMPSLSSLALDIETYNPMGAPRENKDPIIMISYATGDSKGVLTYKENHKSYLETHKSENKMIERLSDIVKAKDPDILFGYNSGNFDLPYLQARADVLDAHFSVGRTEKKLRKLKKGMVTGMRVDGRIHVDVYPAARFFGFIGLIKAQQFTLEQVYNEVMGKKKLMVRRRDIWQIWDNNQLDELAEYSLMDAEATYELGMHFLPLQMELAGLAKIPLFEAVLSTSGQMVESILMYNATRRNEVIPARPSAALVSERLESPIEGAYVKMPEPGIYENIAVLDFRGLYPSIIVSYNIDPVSFALARNADEKDCFVSPTGARFVKSPCGLIPTVVDWLIDYRVKIKNNLKSGGRSSEKYRELSARSLAVKICTNTVYGYLGFARSRWYLREAAESTTAWGRKHILDAMGKAERAGFRVLYMDTDSLFLIYTSKEDVLRLMEDINRSLPEKMELELEGFYPRGVFVSKKAKEQKGAKKKYALLGEDGRIKIRGFELVRRDWSEIAKTTQLQVLETILREGSKEKAVAIVRKAIERLRSGDVEMNELAIETQLNKDPGSYEVTSPELSAAAKAVQQGIPVQKGSVISYVITRTGKSISEKAQLAEFATDYDADYYINNQVLPAVMKLLKELGYDEYDLKVGGKQRGLGEFI